MLYNERPLNSTKGNEMTRSVGMAILITRDNQEMISVVNGGLEPKVEEERTYFYFPYSSVEHSSILTEEKFFEKYRFASTQETICFVNVDEI